MKKIPTLFERIYENHRVAGITQKVIPGFEWVLEGEGIATVKYDGACCAVIGGELYKRYDAKKGKKPPAGAVPCCEPDPVTGHWPHWVKCDKYNPADQWFVEAFWNYFCEKEFIDPDSMRLYVNGWDGTYEALGPHFQGNPYHLSHDILLPHGKDIVEMRRTFDAIRDYLSTYEIEGLVFWRDDEPQCKIKRTDFGYSWPPVKEEAE